MRSRNPWQLRIELLLMEILKQPIYSQTDLDKIAEWDRQLQRDLR